MTAGLFALAFVTLAAAPEATPWRHTLFLQFDGAALTWVPSPDDENAALGYSFLSKFEGSVLPPYDGEASDRAAVLDAVRAHLDGIGVSVVAERPPPWVPYTMAVVGGQWDDTAATSIARGVAPEVDCMRQNQRHIVFAFVSASEPAVQQATTISQEAGHAWGLDHVVGDGLVMGYDFSAESSLFSEVCVPLCERACQGPDSVYCTRQHAAWCAAGMQNSTAELVSTFGDAQLDTRPPEIEILAPADGASLGVGDDLLVEIAVTDDYGGVGWHFELLREGESVVSETAFEHQTQWSLSALPQGSYEVRIVAQDHADHQSTASVFVEVGSDDATADTTADTTAGSTTAQTSTSGLGLGPGSTGETSGVGPAADGTRGCGCGAPTRAPRGPLGALFVVALVARRRRSAGHVVPPH